MELHRGTYRVRGEVIDIFPAESDDEAVRVELFDDEIEAADTAEREAAILEEISALEAADVPEQQSLISIRDNRLAELRQELAVIRGEAPATEIDAAADGAIDAEQQPDKVIRTPRVEQPGIMDTIMGKVAAEFDEEVNFFRIDVDSSPDIIHQLGIRRLPSVYFFKDGEIVGFAIKAASPLGYGGEIGFMIGVDPDGTIIDTYCFNHMESSKEKKKLLKKQIKK